MKQPFYLVAGLGKTGHSMAAYLQRRHIPFALFDTRAQPEGLLDFTRDFPEAEVFLQQLPEPVFSRLTGILVSPGVALEDPVLREASRLQIPLQGDVECLAKELKAPVIAITGTNGKSTVTSLVGEMARAAGLSTAVAGNIGTPVLDLLDDEQHYDIWVLELSSFQLDLIESLRPVAASILNISPDHLDRHHSLDSYIAAKQRIYQHAGVLIHNREDLRTYPADVSRAVTESRRCSFGLDRPAPGHWGMRHEHGRTTLACGEEHLMSVDDLRLKGTHNWQNALAACALAQAAGIDQQHMVSVLSTFSGLPHRCQWVRTLNSVEWINDSKGTNTGATISAIAGIGENTEGKIVLIAGGLGKGADFTELRTPVSDYVRSVVLMGADAGLIEQALVDLVPVRHARTLNDAVMLAKQEAHPGDVVLLSPACASQDMFRDFNHRGESYVELVGQL